MQERWWGTFNVAVGQSWSATIGPLTVTFLHKEGEWEVHWLHDSSWRDDSPAALRNTVAPFVPGPETICHRYVIHRPVTTLKITPVLADRPVVTRPVTPFYIPAGQKTAVYVSTLLWIRAEIGGQAIRLTEMPIRRPSDTWFGPDTTRGELCYAAFTNARLTVEELPKRAHRAITPITIHNQSKEMLLIERIKLPVPFLKLYHTSRDFLWSQGVTMTIKEEGDITTMEPTSQLPPGLGKTEQLAEARKKMETKTLISTISSFFA